MFACDCLLSTNVNRATVFSSATLLVYPTSLQFVQYSFKSWRLTGRLSFVLMLRALRARERLSLAAVSLCTCLCLPRCSVSVDIYSILSRRSCNILMKSMS